MRKKCCMCKRARDLKNFKSNKRTKDGFQAQCIDCHKKYRRKHYLKNRQKYLDKAKKHSAEFREWWWEYKSQFSCEKCGESHPACIDFHHIDEKNTEVGKLVSRESKKLVIAEIKKCIPLCSNCHRKLHYNERL